MAESIQNAAFGDGLRLLRIIEDGRYKVTGGVRDRVWFKRWLEQSGRESMPELAERLYWEQVNYSIENYLPKETVTLAHDNHDLGIARLVLALKRSYAKQQWQDQIRKIRVIDSEAVRGADFAVDKERIRTLSDLAIRLYTKMIETNNYNHQLVGQFRGLLDDIAKETGGRCALRKEDDPKKPISLAEIIKVMNEELKSVPIVEVIEPPYKMIEGRK